MGLFFNKNKKKQEEKKTEPAQQADVSAMDPLVRPGGVFMMQLLMKQPCDMPSEEQMGDVLTKYMGYLESAGKPDEVAVFAAMDYMAEFQDGQAPVQLMIGKCDAFKADEIDEMKRRQMWDCGEDRDRILSECRYQVTANDMLGGALPPKVRADMLMDWLDALLELYPSCEAVYFLNSGKLIRAEDIRNRQVEGLDRFIKFAVNVRFYNIEGTEDSVVDTLGLSLLYIEDLQYHFHTMDPNWVVMHAYNVASYLLENDAPMRSGDTIDGIAEGRIVQDIQWKCRIEGAMIKPERAVLDVHMDGYAAGNR